MSYQYFTVKNGVYYMISDNHYFSPKNTFHVFPVSLREYYRAYLQALEDAKK